MSKFFKRGGFLTFVIVAALGISIGFWTANVSKSLQVKSSEATEKVVSQKWEEAIIKVAEEVGPAVVNISAVRVVRYRDDFSEFKSPFFNDDFFDEFFKHFVPPQKEYKERSLGSGFVVREDGYILTNYHVVGKAEGKKVKVSMRIKGKEKKFAGKLVGVDPRTDLALVKIKAKSLPVVKLGASDKLKVGERVVAIGNPFGFDHTVTDGIISAKGRNLEIKNMQYQDLLQTNAAINPGNSGGPLINLKGEVIGINTAIASPVRGFMGIGFAIPINRAKDVLQSLIEEGKVVRGYLGIIIQELTSELAQEFNVEEEAGVLIAQVMEGGAAEEAGLKEGDIIKAINGKSVKTPQALQQIIGRIKPSTKVNLLIIREGKEEIVEVKLGEMPEEGESPLKEERKDWLGLSIQTLTPELAERLSLDRNETGVVVLKVEAESPAEEAGIQRGDVIKEINHKEIKNTNDYDKTIKEVKAGENMLLYLRRGKYSSLYIVLKAEKEK